MYKMFDMSDGFVTPLEMIFISSEEYANEIIKTFKSEYSIYKYPSPEACLLEICDNMGLIEGDLLPEDKKRVENEIKRYLMRY